MANREIYPSSLFPLRGDLAAEAGATKVVVVGIQQTPVSDTPPDTSSSLVVLDGTWTPKVINASIQVNSVPVSDDYDIYVNVTLGTTNSPVLVNGA